MIEWIVTSSALILLVILLRVMIKGRVNPRLRYALWALVLLRLLIPGTLWESRASVMTPVAVRESYQIVERVPRYVRTQPDGWVEIGHPDSGNRTSIPPESDVVSADRPTRYEWFDPEEEVSLTELRKQADLRDAFLAVWLGGAAIVGSFLLAVNLKFSRNLRKKRRMVEQYRGRWVFAMESLPTPCLFGLFRPGIYLTHTVAADETAKEHVLAHEYTHFRQGDHIWAILRGVCLAIHWYNPLVWLAAYLSRRDCELSCDEGAVRLLGEDCRADYGRTLVGLVARRTTPKDLACCATTMTGGKSALKERIALLVKHPRTTAWMACIVAAACVVFAVCTFTGAAAETSENPDAAPAQAAPGESEELENLPVDEPAPDYDLLVRGAVSELVYDFQAHHQVTGLWIDPDMGENPGPSYLSVEWGDNSALLEVSSWALKTGGWVECSLDEEDYDYSAGSKGGTLTVYGEARYVDCPMEGTLPLRYTCAVSEHPDGVALGPGALFSNLPEDLPTELMDLTRPVEEQGLWLLLAETPGYDIALYRSAWDDRHVYLRVTNMSFQAFDRDLSGMELLPVLELVDGDADLTVQALYRRYEGTYFNGASYEPGIVGEMAIYEWSAAGKYWTERYFSTQPAQLTEDRPALADLPTRLVSPGTAEAEADIWLIGELRSDGILVYYEQSTGKYWLRYGDAIQEVEGLTVCMPQMLLPELHFEDLDGDGDRELIAVSREAAGTGISRELLSVYEWDGESWSGTRHTPDEDIEWFNNDLDLIFEFYEDGTAFIKNRRSSILLDLSNLWKSGYWESAPKKCRLSQYWTDYTYEDGQITLTIAGGLWNEEDRTYGYIFDYVCPVIYMDHGHGESYLGCGAGVFRSDYAVEPELPELTDKWRTVLEEILAECNMEYPDLNAYAVHDLNGDGEDELIVIWDSQPSSVYSWGTAVYNTAGKCQFSGLGELTFYSNGAIMEGWSHNQGAASAMWPYDLYVYGTYAYNGHGYYNTNTYPLYSKVGSARARSSDVPGFEDVAYADLDGDGVVYYLGEDAYKEEKPVDNAVYEAWLDRYLAGAQVLPVMYWPLTGDAIS